MPSWIAGWLNRETLVLASIFVLMLGVFAFDIATPPDDVSICFIYAVLISGTSFSYRGAAYASAALATILSGLGAFIRPPNETLLLVFFANRAIAIAAQWLVAFLVTTRQSVEQRMRLEYEAERKKVETSRRFVDVLSHEIGTSLTMIDGQAFRFRRLIGIDDHRALGPRADKIRQAVRHIESVVRQVQIASELDQGKTYFHPVAIDLKDLIADLVLQVGADREIQTDLEGLPPSVWGDANMVQQILVNLVTNAIKYSPAGSPVTVRGETQGNFAVLSVADRGRGIPPNEQAKLVEPYFRASNSRTVHGAGIGLYVVDRYIASHGGSIDIDSRLGVGTTVTIRLPISPDESRVSTANPLH